jgi:hypothetical protein
MRGDHQLLDEHHEMFPHLTVCVLEPVNWFHNNNDLLNYLQFEVLQLTDELELIFCI